MKRLARLTGVFVSLLIASPAVAEEVTVTVKGMVCTFCAQGIKKTFSKKPGVEVLEVDLDKKVVRLKLAQPSTLADEDIVSAITDAGYDVLKIDRGPDHE